MSAAGPEAKTVARGALRGARFVAGFLRAAVRRFHADHGVQTAGSLTFTTLLALVPLLTVALSFASAFPVFDETIRALRQHVAENFLPDAPGAGKIAAQITAFAEKAGRLTAVGLGFLALTAVMLMLTVDEALNRIFRVGRSRPLVQRLLMYWSVLTLAPVLIGASLSMTSFLVGHSIALLDMGGATGAALRLLPFVFTCAAFTLLYVIVPYRRIELRHALAGGLLATLAFEFAKRGFALYLAKVPTYTLVYGAFATVPIFLLWVYLSWLVVLAGATLAAMLPGYRSSDGGQAPGRDARLDDAFSVLQALARAHAAGGALRLTRLAAAARLPPERCEGVLARCARLGWAARGDGDSWVLARDAAQIRIADIYRAFVADAAGDPVGEGPLGSALAALRRHIETDLALTLHEVAAQDLHPPDRRNA